MTNSILLENINCEGLKEILSETIRKELSSISIKKEDKFLTRAELSEKLHISLPTLDNAIKRGKLKAYRIGGRILIKESELQLSEIPARKRR